MISKKIIRVIDVQQTTEGCQVVYYIEDRQIQCVWEGTPPQVGDVFTIEPERPGVNAEKRAAPSPGCWPPDSDVFRWRKPLDATGVTRIEILRRKNTILRAVRNYLDNQGYLEIDAPLLVHGASPDLCIDSFRVEDRYLISSSEYQIKRLAIGGISRLYSLTKNFRRGDVGQFRNPEFTMLEWGGNDRNIRQIESDAEKIAAHALDALNLQQTISYQGRSINLKSPWDRIPVLTAIERATGAKMKDFDLDSCSKAAIAAGLEIHPEWAEDRDFLFSLLMDHIQPKLGIERPLFLTEWPAFQTTSAASDPTNSSFVNRSELFIAGIEIADGFAGLADAEVQKTVFDAANDLRIKAGKEPVLLDESYLAAMRLGSPYGAGMALGFDRLVMLLTDQSHIRSVLAFAWDEV